MNRFTPYSRKLTQFDTMRPFRRSDKALNNIEPKSYGDGHIGGHGDGYGDGGHGDDHGQDAKTAVTSAHCDAHTRPVASSSSGRSQRQQQAVAVARKMKFRLACFRTHTCGHSRVSCCLLIVNSDWRVSVHVRGPTAPKST